MNLIWIVSDTFRRDHLGVSGAQPIHTPALDALAARAVRFTRHYAASFPTMPARADYFTGRWSLAHMSWEPLPAGAATLANLLAGAGYHTAAIVDTPFYLRNGMNYDRGFQTFFPILGQEGAATRLSSGRPHESRDVRNAWRHEEHLPAPQTVRRALRWLEEHHRERFFLFLDTWDPHEPWDAPAYYTRRYWPDYDGEDVPPRYARWPDIPGLTEEKVRKAHAAYCGEITLVDVWLGFLFDRLEAMGMMEETAIIFTSDHGFYFGEHGGCFGKMILGKRPDGKVYERGESGAQWDHSPLYEEVAGVPLLVYVPGATPAVTPALTSAVDLMPTALQILGQPLPEWVQGRSLLPLVQGTGGASRDALITSLPLATAGEGVRVVDDVRRTHLVSPETSLTTPDWSFIHSVTPGRSELFYLPDDPGQERNLIGSQPEVARELHGRLLSFFEEIGAPEELITSRRVLEM